MESIALLTEDEVSEVVGVRILQTLCPAKTIDPILRQGGSGYLKSKMKSWSQLAGFQQVFLLTDLDRISCPIQLVNQWFHQIEKSDNFIFRVAVREIESWLLADHVAMRRLFGSKCSLPEDPDGLADPKQYLLALAKKSNRRLREDLVAEAGSVASQGILYNWRLGNFVKTEWCPFRAAERSSSLRRALNRISPDSVNRVKQ